MKAEEFDEKLKKIAETTNHDRADVSFTIEDLLQLIEQWEENPGA